jgi:4,5-dihydroxyphthalate decarboxylase
MPDIHLTVAVGDYDHIRDLELGRVKPRGIALTIIPCGPEESFFRFDGLMEWEVSEISMGNFCSFMSQDDQRMVGLPIFTSRAFRQSAVYVNASGRIKHPEDLAGARVGIPQWSQTATIYVRGWIAHDVGIPLTDIEWQAGVNQPGRKESAPIQLPPGIRLRSAPDHSLSKLLLNGEIDAAITARPPQPFADGDPRIVRLFPRYRDIEEDYFRRTGLFPIMHCMVLRKDTFDANRWMARNLCEAFEEAKNRSVRRISDKTASQVPLPWAAERMEEDARGLIFPDGDIWPYGLARNRSTLDTFLQYCFEQGVCARRMSPEQLFPKEVQLSISV